MWLNTRMEVLVVIKVTTTKDHALLTSGKAAKEDWKLFGDVSSSSGDCIVLGKCRIDLLQELYQEMREKWNMPIAGFFTHATWGITLLESPLVSP